MSGHSMYMYVMVYIRLNSYFQLHRRVQRINTITLYGEIRLVAHCQSIINMINNNNNNINTIQR